MKEGKKNFQRQTVSLVEDAWIVTNSKSHPGHVYYFNTLTGEAVWNLSKAEIGKTKLSTQIMEQQNVVEPTKRPEPMGNPPATQEVFQNQFQQYRLGDQQTNICQQPGINILQTQHQSGSLYSDISVNNISAFDLSTLNNQINAFNLITAPAVYNPHAPRTQQFFVTPAVPVVNQAQTALNIAYNHLLETDEAPTTRFKSFQNRPNGRKGYKNISNYKRGGNRKFRGQRFNRDLRERISLRRKFNSKSYEDQNISAVTEVENRIDCASSVISRTDIADKDYVEEDSTEQYKIEDRLEEDLHKEDNTTDHHLGENSRTSSNLDLTPLKNPEHLDLLQDDWYIVTDLNILLKEFAVLNMILESDEHCKLVVPENVMNELKDFIASANNIPARRIFHSLSLLIENDNARVAGVPSEDDGATIRNPILNTCFELLDENHHVVLITSNSEILKYKKFIKISMFTIDEVRSLLEIDHSHQPSKDQEKAKKCAPLHDTHLHKVGNCSESVTLTQEPKTVTTTSVSQKLTQESSNILEVSTTIDAAIQTDKVNSIRNNDNSNSEVDIISKDIIEHCQATTTQIPNTSQTSNIVPSVKRREIRLNRSISNQPSRNKSLVNNIVRKPRWRRRRTLNDKDTSQTPNNVELPHQEKVDIPILNCHASEQLPVQILKNKMNSIRNNVDSSVLRDINSHTRGRVDNSYKSRPDSEKNAETSVDTNLCGSVAVIEIDQEQLKGDKNKNHQTFNLDTVTESRESSVVCINIRRENITIDESSTSGVISNSESNIESECNELKLNNNAGPCIDATNDIVMYVVENESMEESLKTKCEEWVSRFIQIMEEVLSVILHKEPMLSNTALPPPWTLHEATQCIRRNYNNNTAIRCATDKLSSLLFDLSDNAGKINMNMAPCQYMMMYSYGVSLLKAVKDIVKDCEDIHIAESYLQTLLNDIKNPYCCSTDFDVDPHDISTALSNDDTQPMKDETDGKLQEILTRSPTESQKKYKLRSTIRTEKVRDISQGSVQKTLKVKINNISKSSLRNITRQIINNIGTKKDSNELPSHVTFSSDANKNIANEKPLNEPNVIRKFIICPQFEEGFTSMPNEEELMDYDEDSCSNTISDKDTVMNSNGTPALDNPSTDDPQTVIMNLKTVNSPDHNKNLFKLMMKMFLQEVRNTLNDVKILCDSCYTELANLQPVLKDRCELQRKAEYTQSHVENLRVALDSMWDGDKSKPSSHIHSALEKAGINILDIDEHLLRDYGNTIDICRSQAEVFLHSIREIIASFKAVR